MKKNILNILCWAGFVFLLGAAGWMLIQLGVLDMVPAKLLVPVIVALAMIVALFGLFLLPAQRGRASRITALCLALLLGSGCIYGAVAALRVHQTMNQVTQVPVEGKAVDVVVLRDDPAQTLEDARGYVFGYTDAFDALHVEQALTQIREVLGADFEPVLYESPFKLVDALYDGSIQAAVLSGGYTGVLESSPNYEGFSEKTRILHQCTTEVVKEPEETGSTDPTESQPRPTEGKPDRKVAPFVFYISGSDTRSQILDYGRSDVNILMVVNPDTKEVLLINTPRDYYVPNPASKYGAKDKLTHCGAYGIDRSIEAMEALYGHEIAYYAQINFTGFETLIDAIGGVTVYSDYAFTASNGAFEYVEGPNEMDGAQALAFARERYAFATGDNQRGKNQMKVISAVIDKATSGTTVISRYSQILDSLKDMFLTSMPREVISELAKMQLSDMAHWDVHSYAVSGLCDMQPIFSAPDDSRYSIMWPDEEGVAYGSSLITRVLEGEKLTDADMKVPKD